MCLFLSVFLYLGFLRDLCEVLLYLLLPPGDFHNKNMRYFLRVSRGRPCSTRLRTTGMKNNQAQRITSLHRENADLHVLFVNQELQGATIDKEMKVMHICCCYRKAIVCLDKNEVIDLFYHFLCFSSPTGSTYWAVTMEMLKSKCMSIQ